jgi:hypothetical protein
VSIVSDIQYNVGLVMELSLLIMILSLVAFGIALNRLSDANIMNERAHKDKKQAEG